jgi:hypothetical protein
VQVVFFYECDNEPSDSLKCAYGTSKALNKVYWMNSKINENMKLENIYLGNMTRICPIMYLCVAGL